MQDVDQNCPPSLLMLFDRRTPTKSSWTPRKKHCHIRWKKLSATETVEESIENTFYFTERVYI